MFEHRAPQAMENIFLDMTKRKSKEVYFCRLDRYNEKLKEFLITYYECARKFGVVIEGRITNPTEQNLAFYNEMMGRSFQMNLPFLQNSLKKWLPRLGDDQRKNIAEAMSAVLTEMQQEGKNENILQNTYIKFMCWLYYKFEQVLSHLGKEQVPKILYEAEVSNYELKILRILSSAGCDILLLEFHGSEGYLKLDPSEKYSVKLPVSPAQSATAVQEEAGGTITILELRQAWEKRLKLQRLYGPDPKKTAATNVWLGKGNIFSELKRPVSERGSEERFFYNAFLQLNGVEDKTTYLNELYQFSQQLKAQKRKAVIIEKELPAPGPEEISKIKRGNYKNIEDMLMDLSLNLTGMKDQELLKLCKRSFLEIMSRESERPGENQNRLMNKAVYLLCWIKRYQGELLTDLTTMSSFLYLGGCQNETECLFVKLLARLPVDVILLVPDRTKRKEPLSAILMEDTPFYEIQATESMTVESFPKEQELRMGTAAYHAERELDMALYQDSGIYRDFQFKKAVAVTLNTMYEEIAILWDQELKFRPNFDTTGDMVQMPVIFAKVSGVKDANTSLYWKGIKALITPDTLVISKLPYIDASKENPIRQYAAEFYKNGRLMKHTIKNHPQYPYGYLKEETQDYILDKLQLLISQASIKGVGENGMEYTVIANILNLPQDIVRMIQRFDFTKKNPKIIYINTMETIITIEDSILLAFLNLVGFDIICFIPTGYQNIEKFYKKQIMEEHQAGEYLYNLPVPKLANTPAGVHRSWKDRIFKRGR